MPEHKANCPARIIQQYKRSVLMECNKCSTVELIKIGLPCYQSGLCFKHLNKSKGR